MGFLQVIFQVLFKALGAEPVSELDLEMVGDVAFHLLPIVFVVPYPLAIRF